MTKTTLLLICAGLAGCGGLTNVDLRTIARAEEMCRHHDGLISASVKNYYQYAGDTVAESQWVVTECGDGSIVRRYFDTDTHLTTSTERE